MSEKRTILTYEGLKAREEELRVLKTIKRKEVAEKIKEARGQGDLSENAEYDSAKEEQAEIEARIVMLEKMLRSAVVIDEDDVDKDAVGFGSRVRLLDIEFNEETTYVLVGSAEADPSQGKISNESPLGSSLVGKKQNDIISINAPAGQISYKILEIN